MFLWSVFNLFLSLMIFKIILKITSQLRFLQRVDSSGAKFDREAWNEQLAPILNMWKKLNQVSTDYDYSSVFLISSYIAPLALRALYLALHSSLFGARCHS